MSLHESVTGVVYLEADLTSVLMSIVVLALSQNLPTELFLEIQLYIAFHIFDCKFGDN